LRQLSVPVFAAQLLPYVCASAIPQIHLTSHKEHVVHSDLLDLWGPRLVQLGDHEEPIVIFEAEKFRLKQSGINFMDITDTGDISGVADFDSQRTPYPSPNATKVVKHLISKLSTKGPKEHLTKLTSFRTRYYRSSTGRDSQRWLLSRIKEMAAQVNRDDLTVQEFEHSWGQNSIIARFNGTFTSEGLVIVGAHQDSTNLFPFLPAPGADDDGSGTVTILEAFRALLETNYKPNRSLEFHWYSAEEGGLLGSQAMAKAYADERIEVYGMLQMDMTAWVKSGTREEVGIITDYVDPSLTEFNKKLVDTYLSIPYVETQCGYACSDHASWGKAGYPSSFTIESTFENSNQHIHSTNDRVDISPEFSFSHMLEFSKLAVAFAVELAGASE